MPANKDDLNSRSLAQFEIMRNIALSTSMRQDAPDLMREALQSAVTLLGLSAARLVFWDSDRKPVLNVGHADSDNENRRLLDLEDELFVNLRKNHDLVSAYMSFGGDMPFTSFTLPLKKGENVIGAILGVQPGIGTLVREDIFLESVAAALSVSFMAAGLDDTDSDLTRQIKEERIKAILEIAASLSHEINNPLTAVIGNIQLLLYKRDDLDDELKKKLNVIEQSAGRIRDVMERVSGLTEDKVTEYVNGRKMIDLSEDDDSS